MADGTTRRAQRKPRIAPILLWTCTAVIGVFLYLPIAVVVVFSTNSKNSLQEYGTPSVRWFVTAFHNPALLASMQLSLGLGVATAVVATVLGSLLAFGLARASTRWVKIPDGILLATLVTPEIATAVSLFALFAYGARIELSNWTVFAAHTTFSIVYVTLIVRTRVAGLQPVIEDAARDLGATETQTVRLVLLPQLLPSIVGAALLTFVLSFDDFVTSMFTTGTGTSPLPVYIYSRLKFGLTPEINAIGTFMLAVSIVLGVLGAILLRQPGGSTRPRAARNRLSNPTTTTTITTSRSES